MKKWIIYFPLLTAFCLYGCDTKSDESSPGVSDYPEDAIHMAVRGNSTDAIKYFVTLGYDVNKKDKDGQTPLTEALRVCGTEDRVVECLLKLGANPNMADDSGETPLELAVSLRQNEKVISLLEHGALLQRSNGKKGTLIHEAISHCNDDVIKKMLECGGEKLLYTKGDTIPNYPVEMAIDISGDIDIDGKKVASMLLDHMDLSYTDEHGNNLLHRECMRGDVELIQMLLEKGMDVNAKNSQGLTPLRLAKDYNNGPKEEKIVTLLLSSGAKESKVKEEDCEPPFIEQDFIAELKQKSNLNERDENRRTSLHYAAYHGYLEAVMYLLSKDVDVNVQDAEGMTPLCFSVAAGNIEITKKLLDAGARLDVTDNLGLSPLNWAITQEETVAGKYELIRILIDKGAPINGTEKSYPPVFSAIGAQSDKALEILIQNGADVNILNSTGETPLMQAIRSENIEGFRILLENGADIQKKNKHGYSVIDILNKVENPIRQKFEETIKEYFK
ncbi:MAG: ankyrin repeat domain-containing protein [Planctomycetota bacterium]